MTRAITTAVLLLLAAVLIGGAPDIALQWANEWGAG